jgi:NAD(P) transhydrogenase
MGVILRGGALKERLTLRIRASLQPINLSNGGGFCRHFTSTPIFGKDADKPKGIPYSNLRIGIPKENFPLEKRVAATPDSVAALLKPGFKAVNVETGAGVQSYFSDDAYRSAGATIVDDVWSQSDIVLKVCLP